MWFFTKETPEEFFKRSSYYDDIMDSLKYMNMLWWSIKKDFWTSKDWEYSVPIYTFNWKDYDLHHDIPKLTNSKFLPILISELRNLWYKVLSFSNVFSQNWTWINVINKNWNKEFLNNYDIQQIVNNIKYPLNWEDYISAKEFNQYL